MLSFVEVTIIMPETSEQIAGVFQIGEITGFHAAPEGSILYIKDRGEVLVTESVRDLIDEIDAAIGFAE